MEHQFRVKKSERGMRLDRFLYEKMGTWSHRQIKLLIDKKKVFINGKNVVISSWNLKPNDRVNFFQGQKDQNEIEILGHYTYISVIYEDNDILAVNKPPFIDYDSFVMMVSAYLKRTHGAGYHPYLGQVHRLDKETSGLLLFTKKKSANILADQFRHRQIRKYYLSLVDGQVPVAHGIIRERLQKGKYPGGKKVMIAASKGGKESHTEFWVKERYPHATLLRLQIKTGRTHQIRVHLASIGHPVLGDKLYGETRDQRPATRRQALHAHEIEFLHPITNRPLKLTAPIPKDMSDLIDQFRSSV